MMTNKAYFKIGLLALCFLLLVSGASAETFREDGKVGMNVQEINWKLMQNSYISKIFKFQIEKINTLQYQVFWRWKNLNFKAIMLDCFSKTGQELLACGTAIHDTYFPNSDVNVFRTHFLDIRANGFPVEALTGNTEVSINRYLVNNTNGNFFIDLTEFLEGEQVKAGYESTIIELTDANVVIEIDPESEKCQDGLCTHGIDIENNRDSNFCFDDSDIYGNFDESVYDIQMNYYKPYCDVNEATCWNIWENLTTEECIAPNTIGYLEYQYRVPLWQNNKWDFVFWFDGDEYVIDPYYSSQSWTFTDPAQYDFNLQKVSVDGNASITPDTMGNPVSIEVDEGSTTSISLVDLEGSEFTVENTLDSNIVIILTTNVFKSTGGVVSEDINVAILLDDEIIQNVSRTVSNDYLFGSVILHGEYITTTTGTHTVKAQFAGENGAMVHLRNTTITAIPLEKGGVSVPHNHTLNISDTTTSGSFEDVDGSDFNIILTKTSRIFALLTAELSATNPNTTADMLIQINGEDGNTVTRGLKTAGSKGSVGTFYTSDELPAGSYEVKAQWQVSAGTLTGFMNLSATQVDSDLAFEKAVATDTTTSGILENIDGLDINISLSAQALVLSTLAISSESSSPNTDINISIAINGVDTTSIMRNHTFASVSGSMTKTNLQFLEAGDYTISGRFATDSGTATANNAILAVQIADINFPINENPTVIPLYALIDLNTITELTNFIETATKPAGTEIKYQLTDDNGISFQYWNGASWVLSSDDYNNANTASDINANLGSFTVGSPRAVKFRAYLHTEVEGDTPFLDDIEIEYNFTEDNNPPTVPSLTDEPSGQSQGSVSLEWSVSTDPEENHPITYNVRLGTTSEGTEILDANATQDLNFTTPSLSADIYYWSVRACDVINNCSDYSSEDIFIIIGEGQIAIVALINSQNPIITNERLVPQFWDGATPLYLGFTCTDPNGFPDLNSTWAEVTNTNEQILSDLPFDSNGNVWVDISGDITEQGDFLIIPSCDDVNGLVGVGTAIQGFYTPDYNIIINSGAGETTDPIVDLTLDAPLYIVQMAFSCDNTNWSDWEEFENSVYGFDMIHQSEIGCVGHGLGQYYVYVAFTDGNFVFTAVDNIELIAGIEVEGERYVAPDEIRESTTSFFALAGAESIGIGLVIVVIIVVIAIVYTRRHKYG